MKTFFAIALALIVVLFAVHGSLYAAGDAAKGKDLYLKKCKACHAEDGNGTPAMLKKFGEKLKPLGSAAVQGMNDEAMTKAFKAAANHKALLKTTPDPDLDNIVAHIRTLKK